MLLGFKANKVEVLQGEDIKYIENVIVGIHENQLSKKGQYSALIGLDLLEGRDGKNEFTTNVSR